MGSICPEATVADDGEMSGKHVQNTKDQRGKGPKKEGGEWVPNCNFMFCLLFDLKKRNRRFPRVF